MAKIKVWVLTDGEDVIGVYRKKKAGVAAGLEYIKKLGEEGFYDKDKLWSAKDDLDWFESFLVSDACTLKKIKLS